MEYEELKRNHPELFSNDNAVIEIILDEIIIHDWQIESRKKLLQEGKPVEWAEIGIVFQDKYTILIRDLVRFSDNQLGTYIRTYSPKTLNGGKPVVVLPILNEQILLVYIYRHATRKYHYELPRGYGSGTLSAEDNARKELEEETGWSAVELLPLGEFHDNTGSDGLPVHMFLARLDENKRPKLIKTNQMEAILRREFVSIEKYETMIRDGIITDGFSLGAYTRAKLKGYL